MQGTRPRARREALSAFRTRAVSDRAGLTLGPPALKSSIILTRLRVLTLHASLTACTGALPVSPRSRDGFAMKMPPSPTAAVRAAGPAPGPCREAACTQEGAGLACFALTGSLGLRGLALRSRLTSGRLRPLRLDVLVATASPIRCELSFEHSFLLLIYSWVCVFSFPVHARLFVCVTDHSVSKPSNQLHPWSHSLCGRRMWQINSRGERGSDTVVSSLCVISFLKKCAPSRNCLS